MCHPRRKSQNNLLGSLNYLRCFNNYPSRSAGLRHFIIFFSFDIYLITINNCWTDGGRKKLWTIRSVINCCFSVELFFPSFPAIAFISGFKRQSRLRRNISMDIKTTESRKKRLKNSIENFRVNCFTACIEISTKATWELPDWQLNWRNRILAICYNSR